MNWSVQRIRLNNFKQKFKSQRSKHLNSSLDIGRQCPFQYNKQNSLTIDVNRINNMNQRYISDQSRLKIIKLQGEQFLKAHQFIVSINKEKLHQKGRFFLLKKQQQRKRQIQKQIQHYEQLLKQQIIKMKKRQKVRQNLSLYQMRARSRSIRTKSLKQKDGIEQKQWMLLKHIERQHQRIYFSDKSRKSNDKELSNLAYLDSQEKEIQKARKKLIDLSILVKEIDKIKERC